ncbi:MAG: HAMP domain-containing protein [Deltaproteobacteria bacterium]|nr:HAMP domain-containing protein [Deltaproteobacteria bacterium]
MASPFRFKSFRTRILVFFLGLLVLVQAAVFISVNTASIKSARFQIDDALKITAGVFGRIMTEREARLLEAARLLSGDFAFKEAYATRDRSTILSALDNHRMRIRADVMTLVSMDGKVVADTLHPEKTGGEFGLKDLVSSAEDSEFGEAASVVFIDGKPYQMVVVPLLVPMPDAWICIGFLIDDRFVQELKSLTQTQVSLLRDSQDGTSVIASTLPFFGREALKAAFRADAPPQMEMVLGGDKFVSFAVPISHGKDKVTTLLQRSLDEALSPYKRLKSALILLFALGLALSVAGGVLMARTVTRPVRDLASGVKRIYEGNYSEPVKVEQEDEIGKLAGSFNHMLKGLIERDRVRSLLGKVVSSAIAEELLKKEIELGGEEREVTILFSDLRGFTTLCERHTPQEILSFLNYYFTRISSVIEANGGVVDKYIGDAVMALFGAPLKNEDDAARSVRTALGMRQALIELNTEFEAKGLPRLSLGVGVNTATVVAGNMGSTTRLNYTVIGDGVNLASRLEGLSKKYGVEIIVSASTRALAPGFVYRELDTVRVKGKSEPVGIYEPVGEAGDVEDAVIKEIVSYHEGLKLYRERRWDPARKMFRALSEKNPACALYAIYEERSRELIENPPPAGWDGTTVFHEK